LRAWRIAMADLRLECLHAVRYKEWVLAIIIYPVAFASLPILLGTWLAGGPERASAVFQRNIGTEAFQIYMLIGANMWFFTMSAIWDFGLRIRKEQIWGSIEQLYLATKSAAPHLLGTGIFGLLQSILRFAASMLLGSAIYGALGYVLSPRMAEATAILAIGLVSVYGFSLLLGGLILRVREAQSLLIAVQTAFALLTGVFHPVSILPTPMREVAYALPMTIAVQDVRHILLGTPAVLSLQGDTLLMAAQGLAYAILGLVALRRFERSVRRGTGFAGF